MDPEVELKQKLTDDLKQAMKGGDKVRRSVIRLVMAAIRNAEIARQTALEDADILGIIAKEVRQRQESIEAFRSGNRPDLKAQEEATVTLPSMDDLAEMDWSDIHKMAGGFN